MVGFLFYYQIQNQIELIEYSLRSKVFFWIMVIIIAYDKFIELFFFFFVFTDQIFILAF